MAKRLTKMAAFLASRRSVSTKPLAPRRHNQAITQTMAERIHIPIRYGVKAKWKEHVRMLGTTEAEMGLAIIEQMITDRRALEKLLVAHRRKVNAD